MAEDLKRKVLQWINKEGYPLEMKASQILRKIGFEVGQSIFYLDSDTLDTREIDIVAYKYYKIQDFWITFAFVIECKSSVDKPWVAFTSKEERLYPKDFIIHRNANNKGKQILKKLANYNEVHDLSLFKLNERTAYGTIRAFSDGADMTYKAMKSATKATKALVEKGNKSNDVFRFFFPIILVDSKLFECFLNDDAEQEIAEIDNIKLVLSNSFDSQRANFVYLITLSGFENLMKQYLEDIDFLAKEYETLYERNK